MLQNWLPSALLVPKVSNMDPESFQNGAQEWIRRPLKTSISHERGINLALWGSLLFDTSLGAAPGPPFLRTFARCCQKWCQNGLPRGGGGSYSPKWSFFLSVPPWGALWCPRCPRIAPRTLPGPISDHFGTHFGRLRDDFSIISECIL